MTRAARGVRAHDTMRAETQRLVSTATPASAQTAPVQRAPLSVRWSQRAERARDVAGWAMRWVRLRASPRTTGAVVIFDPARTPHPPTESTLDFIARVLRSNRGQHVGDHLGLPRATPLTALAVLPGIRRPQPSERSALTLMDGVLAWMGPIRLLAMGYEALRQSGSVSERLKTAFVTALQGYFTANPGGHVILCTSNSYLVELVRIAALGAKGTHVTEVLHGIAATSMEPYYDMLSDTAVGQISYVNLVADLPQFPSIEAHLLRDAQGQIASNVSLNARLADPQNRITLDTGLAARRPILVVGGFSADVDYLGSSFFDRERDIMAHTRAAFPDLPMIYSPHPQIGRDHPVLQAELASLGVEMRALSTLELILHCPVVIGTFSSSVFEAALLERRVLLLPFDDAILPAALLDNAYITRTRSVEDAKDRLASLLAPDPSGPPTATAQSFADLCMVRFGLTLIYDTEPAQ